MPFYEGDILETAFNAKYHHKVRKLYDVLICQTVERDGVGHRCFGQFSSVLSPERFPEIAVLEARSQEVRPDTKPAEEFELLPII